MHVKLNSIAYRKRPLATTNQVVRTSCSVSMIVIGGLLMLTLPKLTLGQQTLTVDVNLMQLVVTVTDNEGMPVSHLRAQDFLVEIAGVPQDRAHFSIANVNQDVPLTLGIAIDTSGSMIQANKWAAALDAADQFVQSMRKGDEFFLMEFDREAELQHDFTEDGARIGEALRRLRFDGTATNIPDSVLDALNKQEAGKHYKKVLLVMTDGLTGIHCATRGQFRKAVRESHVLVYGILIHAGPLDAIERKIAMTPRARMSNPARRATSPLGRPTGAESVRPLPSSTRFPRLITGPPSIYDTCPQARNYTPEMTFRYPSDLMLTMSEESRGRTYGLDVNQGIEDWTAAFGAVFSEIATELRSQYSIGFYASGPGLDELGEVRVRTIDPNYDVRSTAVMDIDQ